MSAYLLYQNAMRDTFKAQNPGMTFGQLAKYTSAMYAEMPPQEKEAWGARAEADKARYLHQLSNYVPPPGYDVKGDAVVTHVAHAPRGRSKGRSGTKKDANAPKRNMSAYLLYQNCMREQFKSENPGMTFGQLAKYTSHMYKSLTPVEKNRWEAHAFQDKARYEAEMASYVPPPGYDTQGNLVEDHRLSKKYMKKTKDPNAPKRNRGSFVFFTFDMRPKILIELPGIKFVEMGSVMGERWRALLPEERKKYEDMAAKDKIRFNDDMQKYTASKALANPPPPVEVAPPPVASAYPVAAPAAYADHPAAHAHMYEDQEQQQQSYEQAYAAQYQQQYADPNAVAHPPQYAHDPNAHHDPYAQAPYSQAYDPHQQQYHYG